MKISIVGSGNVASHLAKAFEQKAKINMVNPHSLEGLNPDSDIILIAVSDDAIKEVAAGLPKSDALVAHTSGSVPLSVLKNVTNKCGVFYPLQTFSKNVELNYEEIPVFIEGSDLATTLKLKELANLISNNVNEANSGQRRQLHLASVFSCNFTNALAGIAEEILKDAGIDFSVLLPLMRQTVAKLENLSPEEAQTGPARRNDIKVINRHLEMLSPKPELKEIYTLLTNLILKKYHDEI